MTRMHRIGSNRILMGIALGCAVAGGIAIGLPREMGWIRFLSAVILGIPAGFALNWVWRFGADALERTRSMGSHLHLCGVVLRCPYH
jgi:hypothetical protein